jgi:hypothetical protein
VGETRQRAALAAALGLAIACARLDAFVCESSADCSDGSFTGVCQPDGYCSFGDASCASGQRYGDHAPGDLAGTCVHTDGTTTGAPAETSETQADTLDGASLEQGSLEGSSLDTTTTTTTVESSSDAAGIDESSTSKDTVTTDTFPETDSTDTQPNDCTDMAPPDPCNQCAYENCCDEAYACALDETCLCYFECLARMPQANLCAESCGPSMALEELNSCVTVFCDAECGAGGAPVPIELTALP